MDDVRFDAWTRRRFGLATGGLVITLGGLARGEDATARRKRKKCGKNKTRCGKTCVKGNCCPGKSCGPQCACRKTVSGKRFCAGTGIMPVCEQCDSDADCSDITFRCVPTDPSVCGPVITASCVVPCGFTL